MGERLQKEPRDFLLDLITSDINLARAFSAVSRSAYQTGRPEQGDFARLKAISLYSEAAKLTLQLPATHQESIGREMRALSVAVKWLFERTNTSTQAPLEAIQSA